jgi:hypothetical protein
MTRFWSGGVMTDKEMQKDGESTNDDEIIELKEEITGDSLDDDDIIDLVEAVDQPSIDDEEKTVADELTEDEFVFTLDDGLEDEADLDQEIHDDVADSLGMEIDSEESVGQEHHKLEDVSSEQIEAALERVVKNLFYEKIDRILVEVIEKTVTKEIDRIKSILMDDASDKA